jgi:hypothetical protein
MLLLLFIDDDNVINCNKRMKGNGDWLHTYVKVWNLLLQ